MRAGGGGGAGSGTGEASYAGRFETKKKPKKGHHTLYNQRMTPRVWLLLLLVVVAAGPSSGGAWHGARSAARRLRAPPSATLSAALWPETPSGEPLLRAKPIVAPADATWGSIWLPLDAVFDLDAYEHTDMKMRFNAQYPAKVGRRVQAGDLTELQHRWKAYKSATGDAEEAAMEQQADRTGEISELDSEDGTVKVRLDADSEPGGRGKMSDADALKTFGASAGGAEEPAAAAYDGGADEDPTWIPIAALELAGSSHAVGARVVVHPHALLMKAWAVYDEWDEDYAWQASSRGRILELDLSDGTALVSFDAD